MLYDRLSRAGHNRRSAVLDTVLAQQRRMAYGREIDPVHRVNVEWTSTLIAELVNHVGDAVSAFLGRCWYREKFLPLFRASRRSAPSLR
jgi:hypothetical protein